MHLGQYWVVKYPTRRKLDGFANEQRINSSNKWTFTIEIRDECVPVFKTDLEDLSLVNFRYQHQILQRLQCKSELIYNTHNMQKAGTVNKMITDADADILTRQKRNHAINLHKIKICRP